ncbi:Rieske 2Fe-2S domain-containing protein [Candidatus Hecatella orcuttiae]|uniref:Rieske 2Fe-2S domain-containing protein n=1 Tax=Candidatus Hecatella orcuttiae TaxID=1935119 RepID=UPI002867D9A6|nr:Rieske 2Fe-2S domain-containing protein [Candidatus Hecatella orcuttiae]
MEKIANLKDVKPGGSLTFNYKGEKAILVRTKGGKLVAYLTVCPHEGGNIEWDEQLNKMLCECHLSLFNVEDGSVYRHSSLFELNKSLTKIELKVDENQDVYAL